MTERYDVAIVGAGPAGSIFAKELSREKPELSILLIDGQDDIHRKPCGGLLAPDAQKVLAKLNLTLPKEILADPQIFTVETIDLPRRYIRYYQRFYLNMDRFAFDCWLLSLVSENVDIVKGRCVSVAKADGGYSIGIQCAEKKRTVFAKTLVGADGGGSIVRRSFFKDQMLRYVSIQQIFENKGQQVPYYSCIFDPETSDSCSWTIHKDRYVIFGGAFRKEGCRQSFEKQKARFEEMVGSKFGEPIKTEACLVSSPRKMGDFLVGKERVFLLGEAAGFISPSSFEGLSSAILSGKYLAEAFTEGWESGNVLAIYRKKTRKLRIKLRLKELKRWVIFTPFLRNLVMKSGIQSIEKY